MGGLRAPPRDSKGTDMNWKAWSGSLIASRPLGNGKMQI